MLDCRGAAENREDTHVWTTDHLIDPVHTRIASDSAADSARLTHFVLSGSRTLAEAFTGLRVVKNSTRELRELIESVQQCSPFTSTRRVLNARITAHRDLLGRAA